MSECPEETLESGDRVGRKLFPSNLKTKSSAASSATDPEMLQDCC